MHEIRIYKKVFCYIFVAEFTKVEELNTDIATIDDNKSKLQFEKLHCMYETILEEVFFAIYEDIKYLDFEDKCCTSFFKSSKIKLTKK